MLIWKQSLIWFNLQRDGTENGLSNIKNTFAESFAATNVSSVHEHLPVFIAGLSSAYDGLSRFGRT